MPKPVGDTDKEKDSNGGRKSVPFLSIREKQTIQQAKPQRRGRALRVKSEGWRFGTNEANNGDQCEDIQLDKTSELGGLKQQRSSLFDKAL